jgi:hypothetical protein
MAADIGIERKRVTDRNLALGGPEDRVQDERVTGVLALYLELVAWSDQPVTGILVEQPTEHRR